MARRSVWQTRRFKIAEHEEYGSIGLAPTWMSHDQADPLGGMGVAHDILEHGDNDTVEWQGLGGAVYIRGSQGWFGRSRGNPDPVENIASDFVNLFHLWQGEDIPDPGRTYPVEDDEMIVESVQRGARLVREEMLGQDTKTIRLAHTWTRKEQQRRMIGWMRKGYRACARRWREIPPYDLSCLFSAIEEAVDRYLESEAKEYEGAECEIRFNAQSITAHVETVYEEEY